MHAIIELIKLKISCNKNKIFQVQKNDGVAIKVPKQSELCVCVDTIIRRKLSRFNINIIERAMYIMT